MSEESEEGGESEFIFQINSLLSFVYIQKYCDNHPLSKISFLQLENIEL